MVCVVVLGLTSGSTPTSITTAAFNSKQDCGLKLYRHGTGEEVQQPTRSYCSSRGPELGTQHRCQATHKPTNPLVTPAPAGRESVALSGHHRPCTHVHGGTHTCNLKQNLKNSQEPDCNTLKCMPLPQYLPPWTDSTLVDMATSTGL